MIKLKILRFLFPKKYAPPQRGDRTFLRFDTSQIEDKDAIIEEVYISTGSEVEGIKPKMTISYTKSDET
jgi:hypothetical protein